MKRRRSTAHGQGIRIGGLIVREDRCDDLGLVAVLLGELGANGAIDHASDQCLPLVRATFALEVVPRNRPVCTVAILILASEWKEVEPSRAAGHSGDQHGRVAHTNDDRSVGLLGHKACFKSHCTSADFDRHRFGFHLILQMHGCAQQPSIGH